MEKEKTSQIINRPKFEDLDVGDKVTVSVAGFGIRTGIITDVIPEIKNGRDGITYDCDIEGNCWAYVQQIDKVTKQILDENKSVKHKM